MFQNRTLCFLNPMPKQKIDCLFIHVPCDIKRMQGFVMYMSTGLFSMADHLQKHGFSSKIIHLGVKKILNQDFTIEKYLKTVSARAVGISLHWHQQSKDCIDLVKRIRSVSPNTKIILGGFTASFFADEIMKRHADVDFVIRGEGEVPLLKLMKELSSAWPRFSEVPNLSWRDANHTVHNAMDYVSSEKDVSDFRFSNFDLMEDFLAYTSIHYPFGSYSRKLFETRKTFFLNIGRGCPLNCSFCGGSSLSQRVICNRDKVIFRPQEKVLQEIEQCVKAGIDTVYICFDPQPHKEYYIKLFRLMRRRHIRIGMIFEFWTLPTIEFIDEFKKTFGHDRRSLLTISPETGSESLRKRHKGIFYSNRELLNAVRRVIGNNISINVFFSYPLPFERVQDMRMTRNLAIQIDMILGDLGKTHMFKFDLDPGSPMYLCPEKYRIVKKATSFASYCNRIEPKFLVKDSRNGRLSKAFKIWQNHDMAIKFFSQGKAYFKRHLYKEAIAKGRAALKLSYGNNGVVHLFLALCYEKIGQYESAIGELKRAQKLRPQDSGISYLLARFHRMLGHVNQANLEMDILHSDLNNRMPEAGGSALVEEDLAIRA